ncbi:MAG: Hsp70 family protein [Prochlorothrix sp.]
MTLAIDFGTSNTVVARWNPVKNTAETLKLVGLSQIEAQNPPVIPSWLYVEQASTGQVIAGQRVRDRGLDQDQDSRFFRSFKRGIGSAVQGFLPPLDGQNIRFEQVGQWFLETVLQEVAAVPLETDSLVVTVPVDSFESYRQWLGGVFAALAVNQVRMIDEPTAAALGYGVADRSLLLVVDFGGGTLDLSLVKLAGSGTQAQKPLGFILKWGDRSFENQSGQRIETAQVLAKVGRNLGGADLDNWLADFLAQTHQITPTPLLTRLAERIKIQLSSQPEATESYFDGETFESYSLQLSRSDLRDILRSQRLFEELDGAMEQLLQQARRQGISSVEIENVLLVGGTTQIPAIQEWIQGYFPADKVRSDKPFEAIAHGALQLAQGVEVQDFLYHSYGIRYWNPREQRQDWHRIIPAGQAYPMSEPIELVLGASVQNQPSIELVLGELTEDTGAREVFFEGGRLVTRSVTAGSPVAQVLNATPESQSLAPLDPPGAPGSDRVRVLFQVDGDRQLRVTVEDLFTSETLVDRQVVAQLR